MISGGLRGSPLEFAGQLRSTSSLNSAMANAAIDSTSLHLAPDTWKIFEALTVSKSATISGSGKESILELQRGFLISMIDVTADDVVIENLTIKTESETGATGLVGITITGDRVTVRNCVFVGFKNAILVSSATDFVIEGCRISNQTGAAIDINNGDYGIVRGNIIATNATGNEIDLDTSSQYNTVYGNVAKGGAISIPTSGGQANKYAANSPAATTV